MSSTSLIPIVPRLITAGSGQDMYRTLVTRIRRTLGHGVSVSFFLVYRSSDLVLPVAESTEGDKRLHPEAYTQKVTTGIVGRVVKTGKTHNSPDVTSDPLFVSGGQVSGSELCVPVQMDGEVVGILNIESPEKAFFTAGLVAEVELIASVAGILMNTSVMQEQLRAVEAQLKGAMEGATSVDRRFSALASALDSLVLVVDGDGRIIYANGAWKKAFAEARGREFDEFLDDTSMSAWEAAAKKGGALRLTLVLGKKKVDAAGRAIPLAAAGSILILDAAAPAKEKPSRRR